MSISTRYDIYRAVHKGLRLAHGRMLARLGNADFADAAEAAAVLAELDRHLMLAASHLRHEEDFIHPALEGRAPGAAAALEEQHRHHGARFGELAALIAAVRGATAAAARAAAAHDLYLAFAIFMAEDFAHMNEEETAARARLCALFTDAEQMAIEGALVGSLPPEENMAFMGLMLPAIAPAERLAMLAGIRDTAPREVLDAVIEHAARPSLPPREFNVLLQDLGLALAA
ncbi:hemerythrin domain-containing protein [Zavarzinia compransoris]|nr:hemerythrin domain-containing protein [Zavarzinia compransoris]TDP48847.1 hemerythrin HHE cation binding domain-containing protein [Zavarzinia compransoris]